MSQTHDTTVVRVGIRKRLERVFGNLDGTVFIGNQEIEDLAHHTGFSEKEIRKVIEQVAIHELKGEFKHSCLGEAGIEFQKEAF